MRDAKDSFDAAFLSGWLGEIATHETGETATRYARAAELLFKMACELYGEPDAT